MKTKRLIILLSLFLLISNSCQDDFLERYPKDGPSDVTFLRTEAELDMALAGVYNQLWFHGLAATGQFEFVLDFCTDIGFDRNLDMFQLAAGGNLTATHPQLSIIWNHFYRGIARANFVLDNIDRVQNVSQGKLEHVIGQVKFMRAYWYSYLIMLWGDVPLVTQVLDAEDNRLSRTSKEEIVTFLLSELDIAIGYLPETWAGSTRSKVTRGAALALKSRIALASGRYNDAMSFAKAVIDSDRYQLFPSYEGLFKFEGQSSSEVIFEIEYQFGIMHHRQPIATGSRIAQTNSTKVPTQSLVDSYECIDGLTIDESPLYDPARPFENRDPRLRQAIAVPGDVFLGFVFETHRDSVQTWSYYQTPPARVGNPDATNPFATFTGYCLRKMIDSLELPEFRNHSSLNFPVIRYGEVLLNFAEAKIELNQIDQECLDAINAIRGRESVQMPPIPPGKSQAEMRTIIRRERKIELAFEGGHRLSDIRRWGIAEEVMPGPLVGRPNRPYNFEDQGVPNFDEHGNPDYSNYINVMTVVETRSFTSPRDYLWPIPQSEMDINENMVQNPGF
jgi:starch-binding outer membrane protein, SusD/RagB family